MQILKGLQRDPKTVESLDMSADGEPEVWKFSFIGNIFEEGHYNP